MLLEDLIPIYYSELFEDNDSLCSSVFDILQKSYSHASRHIPVSVKEAIENDHLHDWILASVNICHEDGICVQLKATHKGSICILPFDQIKQFNIVGGLSSDGLNYPASANDMPGIAQILDIWVEYKKDIEYLILLNDNRYIKIVTQAPKKKRNSIKK